MSKATETSCNLIWKGRWHLLKNMPSSLFGYFSQLSLQCANTFIYIWGKTTNKDLAWVTLHSLSVLMRKAVRGAQARQALLCPLLVWEAVLHREKGWVTWKTKTLKRSESTEAPVKYSYKANHFHAQELLDGNIYNMLILRIFFLNYKCYFFNMYAGRKHTQVVLPHSQNKAVAGDEWMNECVHLSFQ